MCYRVRAPRARIHLMHGHPPTRRLNTITLKRDNSTTMAPIDEAIAELESHDPGEDFSLSKVAKKWGVDRSTLSRRWGGLTGPRSEGYAQQQALSPQQELELVRYIKALTKRSLPPTREMVTNFASSIAKRELGESWVTRFLNRHNLELISKWTSAIDRTRHQADSYTKYERYFDLLH